MTKTILWWSQDLFSHKWRCFTIHNIVNIGLFVKVMKILSCFANSAHDSENYYNNNRQPVKSCIPDQFGCVRVWGVAMNGSKGCAHSPISNNVRKSPCGSICKLSWTKGNLVKSRCSGCQLLTYFQITASYLIHSMQRNEYVITSLAD